jgi:hypothetical protein
VSALAELFPESESAVALDTLAALLSTAPSTVDGSTIAVITTVRVAPAPTVPKLAEPDQELLEPPSTVKVAPFKPTGSASLTDTDCASDGPPLRTVNVYVS